MTAWADYPTGLVTTGFYQGRHGPIVKAEGSRVRIRLVATRTQSAAVVELPLKLVDVTAAPSLARSVLGVYRSGGAFA